MSQPNTPAPVASVTPSPETNSNNNTPSSIKAASHAFDLVMQPHSATPPAPAPAPRTCTCTCTQQLQRPPNARRNTRYPDPDPDPDPAIPPSSHPSIGHFLSRLSSAVEILTHTSPSQSPAALIPPPNAHTQTHSPSLPPGHNQSAATPTANLNRDTASPVPVARTSTPVPKANGNAEASSRATSQHPDTGPSLPTEASVHGAPARVYLNQTVTGSLLEGMKLLAKEQPRDPLRVLGEFLLAKSKELEGGN
ncbi:hypothetical protein DSL72_004534 [Monilinia vaccinii-corymbosi]|uniref:Dpy-30 domain-containing protein n=1 Tax=Monilinia vaccinii-corymbosi TaxID=61207 RepID=A0A8A3P418_9HELO|nr:hypothetical protein DSL72_004534 [Monilinia vaccinii-corymbosi]